MRTISSPNSRFSLSFILPSVPPPERRPFIAPLWRLFIASALAALLRLRFGGLAPPPLWRGRRYRAGGLPQPEKIFSADTMYKNAENKFSAPTVLYSNFHRLFKDISARGENFYLKKRKIFVRAALFAKNLPQIRLFAFNSPLSAFGRPFLSPKKTLRPPLAGRALFSAATAFPLRPCALFSFPSSASCGTVRGDGCCARCGSPATMPPRRWRRRRRWCRPTGPRARETYHSR